MLSSHQFERIYRSHLNDFARDFYSVALRDSTRYDRGSGYFSISSLLELASGLVPFVKAGGIIRLITSVELSDSSCSVIEQGIKLGKEHITSDLERVLDEMIEDEDKLDSLDLIVNLIAAGRLEIRVAYLPDGIYHEKFGIFFDDYGNSVYFCGSANETRSGLFVNRESITVLTSWLDGKADIDAEERYFERLWSGRDDQLKVMDFPTACQNKLISSYRISSTVEQAVARIERHLARPLLKRLYGYQECAIEQFVANGYHHFLQMATGTGKTFTAVKALEREVTDRGKTIAVVIVPQVDLQVQWLREMEENGFQAIPCGGISRKDSLAVLDNALIDYELLGKTSVLICVNRTFFDHMSKRVSDLTGAVNLFLIVDEAHSLTVGQLLRLPDADARLGLSATPERFDSRESSAIVEYFTCSRVDPYSYDLEKAIGAGFLTPYEYVPIYLELPEGEFEEYGRLTRRLAYLASADHPDEQAIKTIRLQRGRILKKTPAKLNRLQRMINENEFDFVNSVVYCGEGDDRDTELPIIREVTRRLNDSGLTAKSFFSGSDDRPGILREFENGFFDTLVAMKCFDQGVDVRKLDKLYIMASDSSRRQTIQRRGRVLRTSPTTGKTSASIFDMVLLPPDGVADSSAAASLVASEVARMREYGSSATNKDKIDLRVLELCNQYDVRKAVFEDDEI